MNVILNHSYKIDKVSAETDSQRKIPFAKTIISSMIKPTTERNSQKSNKKEMSLLVIRAPQGYLLLPTVFNQSVIKHT